MSEQPAERPDPIQELLRGEKITIINLGLERFADTFARQGLSFVQVDWRPPAGGDRDLSAMLAALRGEG
jgi:hypothetical protein